MHPTNRVADWLEKNWVAPSFSGWLLGGFALFFFIAATNTLTGWLYVLSGIGVALLIVAAVLPRRNLRQLRVRRSAIYPVSAGEDLTIEVLLENLAHQSKSLLQGRDLLPRQLGQPIHRAIETIAPQSIYRWTYVQPTQQRGVYRWQTVQLRTAAPLGLFWCQRSLVAKATAVVYPVVLPLAHCPLIDQMGRDDSLQIWSDHRPQAANEGLTRSLRPYRWGDPIRLVHWRSSARYGELRVRELEVFTGGQELTIALDSGRWWQLAAPDASYSEAFEQAVTAAASLYFYASHRGMNVKLWTAGAGLTQGNLAVLETLAAVQASEIGNMSNLPNAPIVWLTPDLESLNGLPKGSRWLLWASENQAIARQISTSPKTRDLFGITISANKPLQLQLQDQPILL
jgi:uncharacterized protein (DUF58 family)